MGPGSGFADSLNPLPVCRMGVFARATILATGAAPRPSRAPETRLCAACRYALTASMMNSE